MSDHFEIVASETLLTSYVFRVDQLEVEGPHGHFSRTVAVHPGAVAVLARDGQGRVGVISQWRAPIDRYVMEIPAGTLDVEGESPLAAAKRELREELGCEAAQWRELGRFLVSPGWVTQVMHIFEALELTEVGRHPEGPEELTSEVLWLEPDVLRQRLHEEAEVDATMAVALNRVYGNYFDD